MNTYKFSGYVTKDYECLIQPQNGIYIAEDMEYDFMRYVENTDQPDEAKSFFLNHVFIQDGKLFANATIKHSFEEQAEGKDRDEAEEQLLYNGDCMWNINKDHKKKALIEINEIERI